MKIGVLLILVLLGVGLFFMLSSDTGRPLTPPPAQPQPVKTPPKAPESSYVAQTRHPKEIIEPARPLREPKEMVLTSQQIQTPPVVDGNGKDPAWEKAPVIETLDRGSQRTIQIRSVYTKTHIYMLVTYPDPEASLTHRSYRWDKDEKIYKPCSDREDVFVFKWAMAGEDLSFSSGKPHKADIWYWKACRTDGKGYADDKHQVYAAEKSADAKPIRVSPDKTLYITRKGDSGRSTYQEATPFEYRGEYQPRYNLRDPQGSRADVRAKGTYADGQWTLEFSRPLQTGHKDDVQFKPGETCLFGISCYEIAGGKLEPDYTQPLYKTGDVFDRLRLTFEK